MRDPHSKKRAYHKGSETAAGDAPSPVTNIVSIGHAAIFHNGKMRLFAAPCHFPSCYAASQGGPRRLFFLCKARKRRCKITILSFSRSICREGLAALTGVTGNLIPAVFHAIVTLSAPFGHLPLEGKAAIREYHLLKKGGEADTSTLNLEPNESKVKRGCEEMNPHFFTAPSDQRFSIISDQRGTPSVHQRVSLRLLR